MKLKGLFNETVQLNPQGNKMPLLHTWNSIQLPALTSCYLVMHSHLTYTSRTLIQPAANAVAWRNCPGWSVSPPGNTSVAHDLLG